jgi:hypothetical protein
LHGSDVLFNFEDENRISVAWFEGTADGRWAFNYVRFDTAGQVLLDLRNFIVKEAYTQAFGIDWEDGIPQLECIVDRNKNTYLIYTYYTPKGWHLGWVALTSTGKIFEDNTFPFLTAQNFLAFPSPTLGFHIFQMPGGSIDNYFYTNHRLENPKLIGYKFAYVRTGIETDDSNLLLVAPPNAFNRKIGPDSFSYKILSYKGNLLREENCSWREYTVTYWDSLELPETYEMFRQDSIVYFLFTNEGMVNLITFTGSGKIIKPANCTKGLIKDIEQMPKDAKKFIKMWSGIIYYFGVDNKGNLYYWNSKSEKKQ